MGRRLVTKLSPRNIIRTSFAKDENQKLRLPRARFCPESAVPVMGARLISMKFRLNGRNRWWPRRIRVPIRFAPSR